MSKYILLSIFLTVSISWIYRPLTMDATDEMIDKYRPSLQINPEPLESDSIYFLKTTFNDEATALHLPGAINLK